MRFYIGYLAQTFSQRIVFSFFFFQLPPTLVRKKIPNPPKLLKNEGMKIIFSQTCYSLLFRRLLLLQSKLPCSTDLYLSFLLAY